MRRPRADQWALHPGRLVATVAGAGAVAVAVGVAPVVDVGGRAAVQGLPALPPPLRFQRLAIPSFGLPRSTPVTCSANSRVKATETRQFSTQPWQRK
jgi:hypothetical protein